MSKKIFVLLAIVFSCLIVPSHIFASTSEDSSVVFVYDNSYNTKQYKCWQDGKSGVWDGVTDIGERIKNAAVVRRGRTVYVKDLVNTIYNTQAFIYAPAKPGESRAEVSWKSYWDNSKGAIAIEIPPDAPVGDYKVQVGTGRYCIENYATLYVIFDPSWAIKSNALSAAEYQTNAYNDSLGWWDSFSDESTNYLNYVFFGPRNASDADSATGIGVHRGAFSSEAGPDGGIFGQRIVEMALNIHGKGAISDMDAAINAYQVVGQRIKWSTGNDDILDKNFTGSSNVKELDILTAEKAALGSGWTDRLTSEYITSGQCYNFAANLVALMRAMGIPARATTTFLGAGWMPNNGKYHVWAEAALNNPQEKPNDSTWWKGVWWKLDSCDPYIKTDTDKYSHFEGNISPIVIDGWGDYLLNRYNRTIDLSKYDPSLNTHTSIVLKTGANLPVIGPVMDIMSSPLKILNLNVDYKGIAYNVPTNLPPMGYMDGRYGYVLNPNQYYSDSGKGYVDNATGEDDVPELIQGVNQPGVIGGWGFMLYRIPVNNCKNMSIKLTEAIDKVEFLTAVDSPVYSDSTRFTGLKYNKKSTNGIVNYTQSDLTGKNQVYVFIQLKDAESLIDGNQVSKYKIRVDKTYQ